MQSEERTMNSKVRVNKDCIQTEHNIDDASYHYWGGKGSIFSLEDILNQENREGPSLYKHIHMGE